LHALGHGDRRRGNTTAGRKARGREWGDGRAGRTTGGEGQDRGAGLGAARGGRVGPEWVTA
jgi:hypothetical protein